VLSQSCTYIVIGGGGGGGGGGGFYSDTTPPATPSNFTGILSGNFITLTWDNPADADFVRVVLVRSETASPTSRNDGTVIYEGNLKEFKDTPIAQDKTYYYSIFSYDAKPNYSQPASISVGATANIGIANTTPVCVKNTSLTDNQIQSIITLLQSFNADALVISDVQSNLMGCPTKQSSSNVSEIPANYKFSALRLSLMQGQRSTDVKYLQMFLKSQGTAIYPEGSVTGFFGPATFRAVVRFQEKYASELLAPQGFTKGTGFAGKSTRVKIDKLMGH